jgi:nucleotide-binding universal stress UspA family protein
VLVAVATEHPLDADGAERLRIGVRGVVAAAPDARVACVSVVAPAPVLGGGSGDDSSARRRIQHLVVLRHWAEPLRLPPERLSTHVLESDDPVHALLAFVRSNAVDHVVVGGPPATVPPGARGSTVAMRIAAAAPCSVTVVRPSASATAPRRGGSRDPSSPG